jgi:hypothetical protein
LASLPIGGDRISSRPDRPLLCRFAICLFGLVQGETRGAACVVPDCTGTNPAASGADNTRACFVESALRLMGLISGDLDLAPMANLMVRPVAVSPSVMIKLGTRRTQVSIKVPHRVADLLQLLLGEAQTLQLFEKIAGELRGLDALQRASGFFNAAKFGGDLVEDVG